MTPVLDTNILIDYVKGIAAAREEISRYTKAAISAVTWVEIMVGGAAGQEDTLRAFLRGYDVLSFDVPVADIAWQLRRRYRMRLPDAAIWATAKHAGTMLITRNTKDFPEGEPDIRVPYHV